MIRKTKHNNQEEEEQDVSDEYQTDDQYEQDRVTDYNAYSDAFSS